MRDERIAVLVGNPDPRRIALEDDGFSGTAKPLWLSPVTMGKFAHISGFNRPPVEHLRPDRQPMRIGVDHRRDESDLRFEDAIRIGGHADFDRLPDLTKGASVSRTLATSQTLDRSPIAKIGSLAPWLIYCPTPSLRCST